jgi:plastocyanin
MTIEDNAFVDPSSRRNSNASVTINAGQAVRWANTGGTLHTVTSTSVPGGAGSIASGNISPGAVFDHTFTVVGTYVYRCDLHPGQMFDSTVIVQ